MRYAICLAVLLASCRTVLPPEEQARRIIEKYGPVCDALGYAKDTDPWRQCVVGRYDADRRDTRARQSGSTSCTVLAGGHILCN